MFALWVEFDIMLVMVAEETFAPVSHSFTSVEKPRVWISTCMLAFNVSVNGVGAGVTGVVVVAVVDAHPWKKT